ncbi:hypothetical protein D9M71_790380 [compost metagenome]
MPNSVSISSITTSSSHAAAWMRAPMMRAFRKYSSLWITTRNTSEATAIGSDTDRDATTMAVLEIRLPSTGSKPATKVMTTSVFDRGRCTPNSGSTSSR